MKKILILGAYGQVGLELNVALGKLVGLQNIVCADINPPPKQHQIYCHESVDAVDAQAVEQLIKKHNIGQIYNLVALLSATGEINPMKTQNINMKSLFICLEATRKFGLEKLFWPSSIACFGSDTPKNTPQNTIMNPTTVYGITKKAGELWCNYYYERYGIDVRSIRYPGLIGYRSMPGGGTTDYAVDIFHSALKNQTYSCYLGPKSYLPMIYTDDAINATVQIMQAPKQNIKTRTSYNINGMSFCPEEIAKQIQKFRPDFKIQYKVNPVMQAIADSWPHFIQDDHARRDWGFKPKYDLTTMTKEILDNLKV